MAKPYSNDLRRKFLKSYDRGKASLRELAEQYQVSLGWAKKISARRTRTGQIDFLPYRRGRKSRVTEEVQQWLGDRVREQSDVTLVELQQGLERERKVRLSIGRLWQALRDLGLRFKKNPSMRANGRPPKPSNGGRSGKRKSKP